MRKAHWLLLLLLLAACGSSGSSRKPVPGVAAGPSPAPESKLFDLSADGIPALVELPADAVISPEALDGEDKTINLAAAFWGVAYPEWSLRLSLHPSRPPDRAHGAGVLHDQDLSAGWAQIVAISDSESRAHVWRSDLQLTCTGSSGNLAHARQMLAMCLTLFPKP